MTKTRKLGRALKKQQREIEKLTQEPFLVLSGFGKRKILRFGGSNVTYFDGSTDIQQKIDDGYYRSIEHFDSSNTADIEFEDLYEGRHIAKYRNRTKINLIELGKFWRERLTREHPDADVTIAVHFEDNGWFLDTYNYPIRFEGGIFL